MTDNSRPVNAPATPAPPYFGWFDFYQQGWQTVVVYQRDEKPIAHRLGDAVPLDRATEMCQVLAEVTGLPVAGELSKRSFTPIADQGTPAN
ncbi:hypothetical protein FAF44_02605 [Nonomuraea sp. MG754425]|uniref:hypothetical protein n=1 Tax=Nonomuraea sp. MG754425 TaxID=2570319 RepID=UPI001F48137F|nr:hypothetical protein [Nonomuraea sp. MG754425]MCF6467304.1 hypothetical protein [Nonomuraea sp. MG754425]